MNRLVEKIILIILCLVIASATYWAFGPDYGGWGACDKEMWAIRIGLVLMCMMVIVGVICA